MTTVARRLDALERRTLTLPADRAELYDLAKFLEFDEICAGQRALEAFGGDPVAALEAGDPVMTALVAAARARRLGAEIGPLFCGG
jgi:hypothetical protein